MSFAPYTLADSSCDMDFYFMENSSFTGSGWTVIWADTGNGPVNTSSHGYEASGRVGIPVESGTYYAMAWTSLDCDTGYAGGTTNSSVVTGMGAFKSSNCLYIMSPSDTYSVGDTVDATLGCSSGFSLAMTVDVTNL